jgi:hypothetical protein
MVIHWLIGFAQVLFYPDPGPISLSYQELDALMNRAVFLFPWHVSIDCHPEKRKQSRKIFPVWKAIIFQKNLRYQFHSDLGGSNAKAPENGGKRINFPVYRAGCYLDDWKLWVRDSFKIASVGTVHLSPLILYSSCMRTYASKAVPAGNRYNRPSNLFLLASVLV